MFPSRSLTEPRRRPRAIIFDLDGTLIDSAADIAAAANMVLAARGAPPLPTGVVKRMIGGGAVKLLKRAFLEAGLSLADPAAINREFLAGYHNGPEHLTRPYAGAASLIRAHARRGTRLALTTNKPRQATEAVLKRLGWDSFFDVVLAADDLPARKPDPMPLREAARRLGLNPRECLYIGDTMVDVQAARAAGMRVVVTAFGYSKVPPSGLGADRVVTSLRLLQPRQISLHPPRRRHLPQGRGRGHPL